MNIFISNLSKFNRKERFFLIGNALGNIDFALSDDFKNNIRKNLPQLRLNVPRNNFVAMDYHIDWIYASLFLTTNDNNSKVYALDKNVIKATQEDIDLIIAFNDEQDANITHLIMCECKAETCWTNKQLISKSNRLREIFGEDGKKYQNLVIPYFLLLSPDNPEKSKRLNIRAVPNFMKYNGHIPWMELNMINRNELQKITRCNQSGKDSINGNYWKVKNTKRK